MLSNKCHVILQDIFNELSNSVLSTLILSKSYKYGGQKTIRWSKILVELVFFKKFALCTDILMI